jgi:hypothetical protein
MAGEEETIYLPTRQDNEIPNAVDRVVPLRSDVSGCRMPQEIDVE